MDDENENAGDALPLIQVQPRPDPAAQAFAGLRQEVALLRRAVEQLASERADIILPDYSATLGKIALTLGETGEDIAQMASSPALDMTPEEFAKRIDAAAQAARRTDQAAQIEARERLNRATTDMRQIIATSRTANEQRRRLWQRAAGGTLFGVLLWAVLPGIIARSVPAAWQWPERMAARALGLPTGEAGARMMEGANPEQWRDIIAAYRLWQDNEKAIARCTKVAGRKGKAVGCAIRIEEAPRH